MDWRIWRKWRFGDAKMAGRNGAAAAGRPPRRHSSPPIRLLPTISTIYIIDLPIKYQVFGSS